MTTQVKGKSPTQTKSPVNPKQDDGSAVVVNPDTKAPITEKETSEETPIEKEEIPTKMAVIPPENRLQYAGLPSEDIEEALTKLFTGGPVMLIDKLSLLSIQVVNTIFQKVLTQLGIDEIDENTNIDELTEDVKRQIVFLGQIFYVVLSDDDVQQQVKELMELLEETGVKPAIAMLGVALEEAGNQLEKESDRLEEIARRATVRIGDAATDSMGTVIAGAPPPFGTAYAALSAIDNLLKIYIETSRSAGELGLSTTNGYLEFLNRVAPEQLKAINGLVDVATNAINTYKTIQKSIDDLNAKMAQAGPGELDKIYKDKVFVTNKQVMDKIKEADTTTDPEVPIATDVKPVITEATPVPEATTVADAKPITPTAKPVKKGGKRKKTKKKHQKKRTKSKSRRRK